MTRFLLPTRSAANQFGVALGQRLQGGEVLGLTGDLGAGKTTVAQAVARGMGITSAVSSPTFALIHEYPGRIPLFHIDPYRLPGPQDLYDLGFEDYLGRGGVVVIEWADKVLDLLPPERLILHLEIASGAHSANDEEAPRLVDAQAQGRSYEALLAQLADAPEARDLLVPEMGM